MAGKAELAAALTPLKAHLDRSDATMKKYLLNLEESLIDKQQTTMEMYFRDLELRLADRQQEVIDKSFSSFNDRMRERMDSMNRAIHNAEDHLNIRMNDLDQKIEKIEKTFLNKVLIDKEYLRDQPKDSLLLITDNTSGIESAQDIK